MAWNAQIIFATRTVTHSPIRASDRRLQCTKHTEPSSGVPITGVPIGTPIITFGSTWPQASPVYQWSQQ